MFIIKMTTRVALLLFLSILTACNKEIIASSSCEVAQDYVFFMHRSECFGTCPVYSLTIEKNGVVSYKGNKHVDTKGCRQSKITTNELQVLTDEAKRIQYGIYEDIYNFDTPQGLRCTTDAETVTTKYITNTESKSISHYHGCRGFDGDSKLRDFEDLIDKITNSSQWVGR